jgi:hypothetical protein
MSEKTLVKLAGEEFSSSKKVGRASNLIVPTANCLRLATHKAVMQGDPFTTQEIWEIYRTYRTMPIIHFLTEPAPIST